jgi:hypothetical protein
VGVANATLCVAPLSKVLRICRVTVAIRRLASLFSCTGVRRIQKDSEGVRLTLSLSGRLTQGRQGKFPMSIYDEAGPPFPR